MGEILSAILRVVPVQWLMSTKNLNWFGKGALALTLVLLGIFVLWFAAWAFNDSIYPAIERVAAVMSP